MAAMGYNPLRELLNRLRWEKGEPCHAVSLVVRVRRGGIEVEESLNFSDLRAVTASGVIAQDQTFLPFHRIVGVWRGGRRLWPRGGTE